MKKDKIEDFIANHRSEFDSDSPPPMVWMNIEKQLDKKSENPAVIREMGSQGLMRVMQIAAMFVVVMGVGLLIGLQLNQGNVNDYANPQLQEFVEAERHYADEINKMWTVVNVMDIEEKDNIQEDMNALDAVYDELRGELLSSPRAETDRVVNAMIDNYRTKIDILQTVLEEYNKEKSNKQTILDDDKVDI